MPYLVVVDGALSAVAAADALSDAFVRIATEAHGLAEPPPSDMSPFDALRTRLDRRTVALSDWKHPNGVLTVSGGDWDRGEVETNLRQIEVIILALRTNVLRAASDVRLNPTQQGGFDAHGLLDGVSWVLEAFGGVNVNNNEKLTKDAEALTAAPGGTCRFFACRPQAWPWRSDTRKVKAGEFSLVSDPTSDGVRLFAFTPA